MAATIVTERTAIQQKQLQQRQQLRKRKRRRRAAAGVLQITNLHSRNLIACIAVVLVVVHALPTTIAVNVAGQSQRRLRGVVPSPAVSNVKKQHHMADHLKHCSLDGDFLEMFHHYVCHELGHDQWQQAHADPHAYFASSMSNGMDSNNLRGTDIDDDRHPLLKQSHDPSCVAQVFADLLQELQETAERLFHEEANVLTLQMGMCNKLQKDVNKQRENKRSPESQAARARWIQNRLQEEDEDL